VLKNLLLYRFALFNGGMAALLGYLGMKGYVAAAVAGDPSGISLVIAVLFLLLMGSTAQRAWKTSKSMNFLKEATAVQKRVVPPGKPWTKRLFKIRHIHDGAQWLAYLGLIGTVVGFIISLSGVDLGALSTAQGVQAMIPSLMAGMKVALYTTLAGAFFGIWTEVNYRMLETATECLVEDEKAIWDNG
jgi:hypothetical protein